MELARAIKVGKEMGKAAARELEAAGTTARAGQKRWSRRESVARAIIPTQRVEQWQKPLLQACSRLARHVLLLPVSSDSLARATTRTNAHTGCMVSCCGTGLKARGLPVGCLSRGVRHGARHATRKRTVGGLRTYGWWIRPNRHVGGLHVGGLYCRWIESSLGGLRRCPLGGLRFVRPVDCASSGLC